MDERSRESSHPGAVGRSRGWKLYLGFGVLAAFLYMLVPPLKGNAIFFNAFGLTSWLAVIVGISEIVLPTRRHGGSSNIRQTVGCRQQPVVLAHCSIDHFVSDTRFEADDRCPQRSFAPVEGPPVPIGP